MSSSYVISMPELDRLSIPEKQTKLFVSDEQIFRELRNEHRRIADAESPAQRGDYVLVETDDGHGVKKKLHIELGGRAYSDYVKALIGCVPGQELRLNANGRDITARVVSVCRPVEYPLTDESIAELCIPEAADLAAYRRKYLDEHGDEIMGRVFRAIQPGLIDQVLDMSEIHLDPKELDDYNAMQLVMVGNISGNADERLMKAYGNGEKTPEECKQLFFNENRRIFSMYVWGRDLAKLRGAEPTEADTKQALGYYCLMFEKTEEEADLDTALMSYYLQYGIGAIREYYKSITSFSAVGIESYSLRS